MARKQKTHEQARKERIRKRTQTLVKKLFEFSDDCDFEFAIILRDRQDPQRKWKSAQSSVDIDISEAVVASTRLTRPVSVLDTLATPPQSRRNTPEQGYGEDRDAGRGSPLSQRDRAEYLKPPVFRNYVQEENQALATS